MYLLGRAIHAGDMKKPASCDVMRVLEVAFVRCAALVQHLNACCD